MDGLQDVWDGIAEDVSVVLGDLGMQKRIGLALSVLVDGLAFMSLARKSSYYATPQLTVLDVVLCAVSVLGTVLFIWPHRRYQLPNGSLLSVWVPSVLGRQLFCYCNPLALLILLECSPRMSSSLLTHVALAIAVTALCALIVSMYERLLTQRKTLAEGSYQSLDAFLSPLAFKASADVATQT